MKFGKRIESVPYLKDVLEVALAFIIAWVFYQGLAFAAGTPMPIVSVVSESMEPILHRGDLVFVIKANDLKVGDIVIYQKAGDQFTIIHRIIEKREDGYIIKGDNNHGPDSGVVKPHQINGKVLFAVPLLGYPRLALYAVGI
mgnify:CR=1 FL=1